MKTEMIMPEKDPLGRMLSDYLAGDNEAYIQVTSPDFEMSKMAGELMFRTWDHMDTLEKKALTLCRGKVLDIGAGSGCHSLVLQAGGTMHVTAMDISPGCVEVMEQQGIRQVCQDSLFTHDGGPYDTLLMLMNGIGLCGSIEGLNIFLQRAASLLNPGGQILADSTDLAAPYTAAMASSPEQPYFGETQFTLSYKDIAGDPFDWLYIDVSTLAFYAEFHGWRCVRVAQDKEGKYLAKLTKDRDKLRE